MDSARTPAGEEWRACACPVLPRSVAATGRRVGNMGLLAGSGPCMDKGPLRSEYRRIHSPGEEEVALAGPSPKRRPGRTWYTPVTLAKRLDVSERTVRNWISRGQLASYKFGRLRRIDPADVDDFLARHRRGGSTE